MSGETITLADLDARMARLEALLREAAGRRVRRPEVPASEAARMAGMSRTSFVRTFVRTGRVRSRKAANGRLLVRRVDVEAMETMEACGTFLNQTEV